MLPPYEPTTRAPSRRAARRAIVPTLTAVLLGIAAASAGSCVPGSTGTAADGGSDVGFDDDVITSTDDTSDAAIDVGTICDPEKVVSPILTVQDSVTGAAICDATLVDSSNGGIFPCLTDEGCTASCQYVLVEYGSSPTATFSVTVTAPGYLPTKVTEIKPSQCGCDAGLCQQAQGVTALLAPVDAGTPSDGGRDAGDATVHDGATDSAVDSKSDTRVDAAKDAPGSSADAASDGSDAHG